MKHLFNYILSLIGLLLLNLVYVVYWPFMYLRNLTVRAFIPTMGKKHFNLAFDLDVFGNYAFPDFWNWLFIKSKSNNKFGRLGETLSSVLGKNQLRGSLTIAGWIMVYILWAVDLKYWFKGGHCLNSIMSDEQIINYKMI